MPTVVIRPSFILLMGHEFRKSVDQPRFFQHHRQNCVSLNTFIQSIMTLGESLAKGEGKEEVPNLTQTSDLLTRLQAFLPKIQEANQGTPSETHGAISSRNNSLTSKF